MSFNKFFDILLKVKMLHIENCEDSMVLFSDNVIIEHNFEESGSSAVES